MITLSPTTPMLAFALAMAVTIAPVAAMPLSGIGVAQQRETARLDVAEEAEDPSIQALLESQLEGPRLFHLASTNRHVRHGHHQPTPAEIKARQQAKAQGHRFLAQGRQQATATEFMSQRLVQLGDADLWRGDMETVQPITAVELEAYAAKVAAARVKAEVGCRGKKACLDRIGEMPLPEPEIPDALSLTYRQAGIRAAMIKHMTVARRPEWWADMLERAESLPTAEQLALVDGAVNTNTRWVDRPGGPWSRTPAEQDKMGALCRDSAVAKLLALQDIDPIRWGSHSLRIVTLAPRALATADGALSAAHVVLVARLALDQVYVLDILKSDRSNPAGRPYALKASPQAARGVLWAGTATASSESWGRGQTQVGRKAAAPIIEAEE